MSLTPAQQAEQEAWCRAERARILQADPVEEFAEAVSVLVSSLIYSNATEVERLSNLLQTVLAEAARCKILRAA